VSAPGHDQFYVFISGFHHVGNKGVSEAVACESIYAAVIESSFFSSIGQDFVCRLCCLEEGAADGIIEGYCSGSGK
jgi:hypothetical protein